MRKIKANLLYQRACLKKEYLGQVVLNLRLASESSNPNFFIERAIQNVLDLKTATATLSDFEQFIKGKTFLNPLTKNEVQFESLPTESQQKIRQTFKSRYEEKKSNKSVGENLINLFLDVPKKVKEVAEAVLKAPGATKDFFTNPKKRKEMIKDGLEGVKKISSKVLDSATSFLKKEFAVDEFKQVFSLFKKDPTNGQKFINDDGDEVSFDKLSKKERYRWREKQLRKNIPKLFKAVTKATTLIAFGAFAYKAGGLYGLLASSATKAGVVGAYTAKGMVSDAAYKTCEDALGVSRDELTKFTSSIPLDKKDEDKKDEDKKDDDTSEKNMSLPEDEKNYSGSFFDYNYEQYEDEAKKYVSDVGISSDEEDDEEDDDDGKKIKRKDKQLKNKQLKRAKDKDGSDLYEEMISQIRRNIMNSIIDKKWHSGETFKKAVLKASK